MPSIRCLFVFHTTCYFFCDSSISKVYRKGHKHGAEQKKEGFRWLSPDVLRPSHTGRHVYPILSTVLKRKSQTCSKSVKSIITKYVEVRYIIKMKGQVMLSTPRRSHEDDETSGVRPATVSTRCHRCRRPAIKSLELSRRSHLNRAVHHCRGPSHVLEGD